MKFLIPLLICLSAEAQSLTFSWEKNPEPDVASYWLYAGPVSRRYTNRINTTATSATIPVLPGRMNYYAVTAVNTAAHESEFSNEVAARLVSIELETTQDLTNWTVLKSFPYAISTTNQNQQFFRAKVNIE